MVILFSCLNHPVTSRDRLSPQVNPAYSLLTMPVTLVKSFLAAKNGQTTTLTKMISFNNKICKIFGLWNCFSGAKKNNQKKDNVCSISWMKDHASDACAVMTYSERLWSSSTRNYNHIFHIQANLDVKSISASRNRVSLKPFNLCHLSNRQWGRTGKSRACIYLSVMICQGVVA